MNVVDSLSAVVFFLARKQYSARFSPTSSDRNLHCAHNFALIQIMCAPANCIATCVYKDLSTQNRDIKERLVAAIRCFFHHSLLFANVQTKQSRARRNSFSRVHTFLVGHFQSAPSHPSTSAWDHRAPASGVSSSYLRFGGTFTLPMGISQTVITGH